MWGPLSRFSLKKLPIKNEQERASLRVCGYSSFFILACRRLSSRSAIDASIMALA
jgi:hypothetical protein